MGSTAKKALKTVAVIGVIAGAIFIIHRSSSRGVLERYKAELRAKGEKLTFKELGVSPSTNADEIACRNTLNTMSNWLFSPWGWGTFPQLMEFVEPGKARVAWRGQFHPEVAGTGGSDDWNSLERQTRAVASNLTLIIQALRHPAPDTGWKYDDDFSNSIGGPPRTFVRDRMVARLVTADTICELHRGNLEAAQNDLRALVALAEMNRNEYTLIHQMIRIAIGQMALNTTWEALQAPGWDEAHLAALQAEWEREDFEEAAERGLIGERTHLQSLMAWVRRSNGRDVNHIFSLSNAGKSTNSVRMNLRDILRNVPWMWYRASGAANEDELFQLKIFEEGLTLARDLRTNRPWCEVGPGATNIVKEIDGALRKDHFHRLMISAIAIPNYSRAFLTGVHAESQRRLTITAIAIKRFQLRFGKLPASLNALVPEYLLNVPIDPMSGKALCYRVKDDGTYILYSVGEDGKDDGGNATPSGKNGTAGLWEGRDAVWPAAASDEEAAKYEATLPRSTDNSK